MAANTPIRLLRTTASPAGRAPAIVAGPRTRRSVLPESTSLGAMPRSWRKSSIDWVRCSGLTTSARSMAARKAGL